MKEQICTGYNPTVWIDASCQEAVFRQSADFPKRLPPETSFRMTQDMDFYRCEYEYGYFEQNDRKNMRREKYIKKYIQSLEDGALQMQQMIYRGSGLNPRQFISTTRIVEGTKQRNFVTASYNATKYLVGQTQLYPCVIENDQQKRIANIHDKSQEEVQYGKVQDAINGGESMLKFIHQGQQGIYSVSIPILLDEIITRDLFRYFDNPQLPGMEEYVVMPEELDFYIDLKALS